MISPKEYAERRRKLIENIGPESIAILPAAPECIRNGDAHYFYRQNSDFYYLTGFKEPEAVVVLAPGHKKGEYILFNRSNDPKAEVWVGPRAGQEGAKKQFAADQAFPIETLNEKLPEFLAHYRRIYYPVGKNTAFDQQVMQWVNQIRGKTRAGVQAPFEFINIEKVLHEMRLKKSPAEIALMRKAAQVSAMGHQRAMQTCRPGMMEYELQAELLYEFSRQECYPPAYDSIVGSGANACILHYVDNAAKIQDGNLVLIDAAGEYQYYAADITRTFPANGRFSKDQRLLYQIVLDTQKAVIEKIKPGIPWNILQETTVQKITEGLIEIGILQGNIQQLIKDKAYADFYMHTVSHWLGLDTHDVGQYRINGEWRKLEAGMVLTIEPGIYIRPNEQVAKKWWNMGIRIEDDILVTEQGHEILSKNVPKEIAEIETLMEKAK